MITAHWTHIIPEWCSVIVIFFHALIWRALFQSQLFLFKRKLLVRTKALFLSCSELCHMASKNTLEYRPGAQQLHNKLEFAIPSIPTG